MITQNQIFSVEYLIGIYKSGVLKVPDFQRTRAWDKETMEQYIATILSGTNLQLTSSIVIAKIGNEMLLIDGNQRFLSILWFMEDKLRIKFSSLSEEKKKTFLSAPLNVILVTVNNLDEAVEIYIKLNKYIAPITTFEFQATLYGNKCAMRAFEMLYKRLVYEDDTMKSITRKKERISLILRKLYFIYTGTRRNEVKNFPCELLNIIETNMDTIIRYYREMDKLIEIMYGIKIPKEIARFRSRKAMDMALFLIRKFAKKNEIATKSPPPTSS
ncbi:MAG: DUF262 domain-containing protein [Thermoproteus sp.]|nr:DUF262 domain-containing protein [Thermoproteus sp.]